MSHTNNNSLLSVLWLTSMKSFQVTINSTSLFFRKGGKLLFTATFSPISKCAYLDGTVQPPTEAASLVSTCPLDLTLWHRRLSHLNIQDVKRMYNNNLLKEEAV